ncbi:hypothetical protein JYU29_04530 [Tianweitania sp. BSSL-BM11]|uniref:Fibronectin attachment protein n=2 Tax=Tianweitania aestuarii TaxID=2814886 RepID=A0ABS5RW80_9HYPH|nr:hypothetical protein [Tianweitania aestuarii]
MRAQRLLPTLGLVFGGALLSSTALVCVSVPAFALSELPNAAPLEEPAAESPSIQRAPLPLPNADEGDTIAPDTQPEQGTPELGDDEPQISPSAAHPRADPDSPPPEILYDLQRLPEPVKRMHQLIVEACKSGDLEKLRPLIGTGDSQTQLTLGEIDGDPIDFIRQLAGDDQGQEILAILEEILEAGYVHLDAGTPEELYVWPYFFALPLDKLTPPQRVELFRIVTAGDFEEMKSIGAYIFYRVAITPEGRWSFFVAGE